MKTRIAVTVIALLVGVWTASGHEKGFVYEIPYAIVAPNIDGHVDDALWAAFDPVEWGNINDGGEVNADMMTRSWAAYDDTHLYIAFINGSPDPGAVITVAAGHDQDVWKDEENELFIEPSHVGAKPYYHIMINAENTTQDSLSGGIEAAWEPDIVTAVQVGNADWSLEVAIPFVELDVKGSPEGEEWGWNFNRHIVTNKDDIWTGWATTGASFHTPDRFGDLIFGSEQLLVSPAGKVATLWGAMKEDR
jgi:hypothetical protein